MLPIPQVHHTVMKLHFSTTVVVLGAVTTTAITSVTNVSAVSGGNITSNGGGTITASGVCWATTPNPVATGPHTTDGATTGAFASNLTGLEEGTVYYVRAYVTNSAGTAYGTQVQLLTRCLILKTISIKL